MKGNATSQNIEWSKNRAAISCKFSVKPPIIKQQKVPIINYYNEQFITIANIKYVVKPSLICHIT